MILIAAGTKDGRELAKYLKSKNFDVFVSVTSDYGASLASGSADEINVDHLDEAGFRGLFVAHGISAVVDASHPYAEKASENLMQAAKESGIKYIRYERERTVLPDYDRLYLVDDFASAAVKAAELGDTVFFSTGSKTVPVFKSSVALKDKRLIFRVLPDKEPIDVCRENGVLPKDIFAMQGPFSKDLNKALFKETGAKVLVSKDSGKTGGTDTKILAAIELDMSIVVVKRPNIDYETVVYGFADIEKLIKR